MGADLRKRLGKANDLERPELWDEVQSRVRHGVVPMRVEIGAAVPTRQRLLTVVVALAVFSLAGAFLWRAFTPTPDAGVGDDGAAQARLSATRFQMVGEPSDVITEVGYGDGSVWVVGLTTLWRVDPASGEVAAAIPIASKEWDSIAVGASRVWLSHGLTISAIDTATKTESWRVDLPPTGFIEDIAVADDALWVSVQRHPSGELVALDPDTGTVLRSVNLGTSGEIQVVHGELWIDGHNSTGTNAIYAPGTDTIEQAPVQGFGPLVVGGLAWYVDDHRTSPDASDPVVVGVDPSTGQTVASLAVPDAAAIAGSGNMLWVAGVGRFDQQTGAWSPSSVTLIDVSTRTIVGGPIDVEGGPFQMAASDDAGWIATYETGGLTKVSEAT